MWLVIVLREINICFKTLSYKVRLFQKIKNKAFFFIIISSSLFHVLKSIMLCRLIMLEEKRIALHMLYLNLKFLLIVPLCCTNLARGDSQILYLLILGFNEALLSLKKTLNLLGKLTNFLLHRQIILFYCLYIYGLPLIICSLISMRVIENLKLDTKLKQIKH